MINVLSITNLALTILKPHCSKITKPDGCHTFRNCFATHLIANGVNIRVVQELMGHADVKTIKIYTHVMEKDICAVQSLLDRIE